MTRFLAILALTFFPAIANSQVPIPILQTGQDGILDVALNKSGITLATSSEDGTVKLWDVSTRGLLRTLASQDRLSGGLAFSPKMPDVVEGLQNGDVAAWNAKTGQRLPSFPSKNSDWGSVSSLAFSPDGSLIAIAQRAGPVTVWRVASHSPILSLRGSEGSDCVVFAQEGRLIIASHNAFSPDVSGSIQIWSSETGEQISPMEESSHGAYAMSVSPDGSLLAAVSAFLPENSAQHWSEAVLLWDVPTRKLLRRFGVPSYAAKRVHFLSNSEIAVALFRPYAGAELNPQTVVWNKNDQRPGFALPGVGFAIAGVGDRLVGLNESRTAVMLANPRHPEIGELPIKGYSEPVLAAAFSSDTQLVAIVGSKTASIMSLQTGKTLFTFFPHLSPESLMTKPAVAFSSDKRLLAMASTDKDRGTMKLWDLQERRIKWAIELGQGSGLRHYLTIDDVAFSRNRKILVVHGFLEMPNTCSGPPCALMRKVGTVQIFDAENGRLVNVANLDSIGTSSLAFNDDDTNVCLIDGARLEIRSIPSLGIVSSQPLADEPWRSSISDNRMVVAGQSRYGTYAWDANTGKELLHLLPTNGPIAIAADGKTLAVSREGMLQVYKIPNSQGPTTVDAGGEPVTSMAFSSNGKLLITTHGQLVKIWSIHPKMQMLLQVTSFEDGNWVAVDRDGRFDASTLDNVPGMRWVFNAAPMKSLPLEAFMADYYEPDLVRRTLSREQLALVRPPGLRDLVQPEVIIDQVSIDDRADRATVVVKVSDGSLNTQPNGKKPEKHAIYDLKLFRNGQLVARIPGLRDATGSCEGQDNLCDWRSATKLDLRSATDTVVFPSVQIPKQVGVDQVTFSAYAFNKDRVKSVTATHTVKLPARPARAGRVVIVSMGVSASQNSNFELKFADSDARLFSSLVQSELLHNSFYAGSSVVTLLSERDEMRHLIQNTATKENLRRVLRSLAGDNIVEAIGQSKKSSELSRLGPDDMLLIYFSGHGYSDPESGKFYLLPYDVGDIRDKTSILANAISSNELSDWMADIDASRIVMVIDACQSAALVQGGGFKPGPLGGRGMGQLAYDKRMQIVTAAQADGAAKENSVLKHGLLTYALLVEGLERKRAYNSNILSLSAWLDYGKNRVPSLAKEVQRKAKLSGLKVPDFSHIGTSTVQLPVTFDFNPKDSSGCIVCSTPETKPRPDRLLVMPGDEDVKEIHFSDDGEWLLSIGQRGQIAVWNTQNWNVTNVHPRCIPECLVASANFVSQNAGPGDPLEIAIMSSDNRVAIVNVGNDAVKQVASFDPLLSLNRMVVDRKSKQIAVLDSRGLIEFANLSTGLEPLFLTFDAGHVGSLVFSESGTRIAAAGSSETIQTWNLSTTDNTGHPETRHLAGHLDWVSCLALTQNGEWIASGGEDGMLAVEKFPDGGELTSIVGAGKVSAVAFGHYGGSIIFAAGSQIVVSDISKWHRLCSLSFGGNQFSDIAVSKDWLASHVGDHTIQLWKLRSGSPCS